MRPTLKDVANLAGVSFTLVSKYLNHDPAARMSPETKARIDSALAQLDYHPSAAARTLRSGRSHTVGMICGNLTNQYFAHAADCALQEFQRHGYQMLIALADPADPAAALKILTERGVDGIYGFSMPELTVGKLKSRCPLLLNNTCAKTYSTLSIDVDVALDEALNSLDSQHVAGAFVASNWWADAFQSACRRTGHTAEIHHLNLDRKLRKQELAAICRTKPPAIFSNGWETMLALQEILNAEFPGYRPRLICHANCRAPFFGDSRISGIIASATTQLIEKSCRMLIKQINNPEQKNMHAKLPAQWIPAASPEYAAFTVRHFQLT